MGARPTSGGSSRLTVDERAEANRLSRESGYRRAGGHDSGRDVQQGFAPSYFAARIIARRNRRNTAATASQNAPVEPQGVRSSTLERSDSPVRQSRRDRRRGSLLGGRFATTTYKTLLGA